MSQERLDQLLEAVGGADGLVILPHNDPDPDAIASAVALRHLLTTRLRIKGHIAYKGIIGRAENIALVRYLGDPLQPLTELDLAGSKPIALVDTQPGAGNNPLPPATPVVIVIDHHSARDASRTVTANFTDVRPELGAASTMLVEYLQAADLEIEPPLATALFYGIKTDTMGLGRNASPADVTAYFHLQPRIDVGALAEIEQAQVPIDYFKSFDLALRAARTYNGVVIAYEGSMDYPDLTAETADLLLRLEGSKWVICMGAYQEMLVFSVRTRSREGGAGRLALAIVGQDGAAGGHKMMAGGQIPLKGRDPEQVAQQLGQHALQHLKIAPEVTGEPLV